MRKSTAALTGLLLAGCQGPHPAARQTLPPSDVPETVEITSLEGSLDSLRDEFNRRDDQARIVVLLSATEGPCALGARAVRESVLESYPDGDFWLAVVWVDMQPSDCARSVGLAARRFVDERAQHFHDPGKRAGRAFAVGLLPTGVAWDVYLFYPPGAQWQEDPPTPLTWSHQLGRIDPDHFHPREMLFEALHESTAQLLAAEPVEPGLDRSGHAAGGAGAERPSGASPPPERTRWAGRYPPVR